ncbi:MAG TPA: 4Fe-4S dicluster domain-containing protein [bacterium]|nr:4Fe-4S dicluster domain-containing protein [bacterium]HOL46624.1 4Fe-4S dicluster domain-containing protein [bacterium]HPQ17805.1 4Fe-4S dicluster domain-containing protein [bacterium]
MTKILLTIRTLNELIKNWSKENKVIAPLKKYETIEHKKYYFDEVKNPEDIEWNYITTIRPPKEYVYPHQQTLLKYKENQIQLTFDNSPQILIGLHPCDIHSINLLEVSFKGEGNIDRNYFEKRNATTIIGMDCKTKCDKSFCVSMGTYKISEGYDAYIRFIENDILLIEIKTEKGEKLFKNAQSELINNKIISKEQKVIEERNKLFTESEFTLTKNEIPTLLEKSYNSLLWKDIGQKCLSCGSCNIVCPTCFCFDVRDENDLTITSGERKRYWDACQLKDFTRVAGNEVFRKTREGRNRHRIFRKFKYLFDRYDNFYCIGCGRCNRACLAEINIVNIINDLYKEYKETKTIKPVPFVVKGESIYEPKLAKIVKMEQFTEKEKWFEFVFEDGSDLGHMPGQFVSVSVFGVGEAPISITSSPTKKGSFELCLRKIGNVTEKLHQLKVGDKVGIRGPFGRGFPYNKMYHKDILFVCGGLGLIPARSLINYILDNRNQFGKMIILYGCKTPEEILYRNEIKMWESRDDVEFHITVDKADENWKGNKGVITTLFSKIKINPLNTVAVIVGPPIMYKFVMMELFAKNILHDNIYMSLERRMKCGVGKCGHCQINGVYVCQEGPVFSYSEIKNLEEAI